MRILSILSLTYRTKRRKRKARNIKVEEEIDEEMLKLLASNTFDIVVVFKSSASLTAESTLSKEEEETPNKRIILESEVPNPTKKVEKKV